MNLCKKRIRLIYGLAIFVFTLLVAINLDCKQVSAATYRNRIVISGETDIEYGGKTQLYAKVYDSRGVVVNKEVVWTCNAPEYIPTGDIYEDDYDYDYDYEYPNDYEDDYEYRCPVTVNRETGEIESLYTGYANIYANVAGYESVRVEVHVLSPKITISPKSGYSSSVKYGGITQLVAMVENSVIKDVHWTCDKYIATGSDDYFYDDEEDYYVNSVIVDDNGKVTTVNPGKQKVYAYLADSYAEIEITVLTPSISLSTSKVTLKKGQKATINASVSNSAYKLEYISYDKSIATVTGNVVKATGFGTTQIAVKSEGADTEYYTVTVNPSYVKLNRTSLNMLIGRSSKLVATKYNALSTETVKWSTSNSRVVTVAQNGGIKAVAPGTAYIYAKSTNGKTATSCRVTVLKPYISLNRGNLTLQIGNKHKLKGVVKNGTGKVSYKSANSKIAKVSASGEITSVGFGTTTITAKSKVNGVTYSASCRINVPVPSISLSSAYLYRGETLKLYVTNRGSKKVSWKSSNTKVVSVDKNGKVKALKAGNATIFAKIGTKNLRCKIKVNNPYLSSIEKEITSGFTSTIYAYGNASNVVWSSSNRKIATIDKFGNITAKKAGSCKIYGKVNGYTMTCKVKVCANKWVNEYPYKLNDIDFNARKLDLRKVYFSGNKLVFEFNFLNRTAYSYKRFNYINIVLKQNGIVIIDEPVYKIPLSIESYSTKKVKVSIKATNLKNTLDLRGTYWYMGDTTYELSDFIVEA